MPAVRRRFAISPAFGSRDFTVSQHEFIDRPSDPGGKIAAGSNVGIANPVDLNGALPAAMVMGRKIHALDWDRVIDTIAGWAARGESRYVCLCNVHSVVTAERHEGLRSAVDGADLALPDGLPIAISLRRAGFDDQPRIGGPDLMWRYCEHAAGAGESVYLFGSTEDTLRRLSEKLTSTFPGLRIAGTHSPPFRDLTPEEEAAFRDRIHASGAQVVFVGLGCPKQEQFIASQRGRLKAVAIGVGAAFDFHAGTVARAPHWMQRAGLEWLHRLASDPRRLARRYFVTNTRFLLYMAGIGRTY